MPPPTYRKSPRLQGHDYLGPLAAHLVFVTRGREPIFADPGIAAIARDLLVKLTADRGTTLHAWCFMPDHAHLLVEVPAGQPLKEFVRIYKQTSGFALKKVVGHEAWQVSYYDRILRREEALEDVANYIWNNPVEAGLARSAADWEQSGPREAVLQMSGSADLKVCSYVSSQINSTPGGPNA